MTMIRLVALFLAASVLPGAAAAKGFRDYPKEWWHFDYSRGSVPTKPRDFPVE